MIKRKLSSIISRLRASQAGQGIVSYVLILAAILLVAASSIGSSFSKTNGMLTEGANRVDGQNAVENTLYEPYIDTNAADVTLIIGPTQPTETLSVNAGQSILVKLIHNYTETPLDRTGFGYTVTGATVTAVVGPEAQNTENSFKWHYNNSSPSTMECYIRITAPSTPVDVVFARDNADESAIWHGTLKLTMLPPTTPTPAPTPHVHLWGEPVYTWSDDLSSCVAVRVCTEDSSHVDEVSGIILKAVTKEATCETAGTTTYSAVFDSLPTQSRSLENIPALGHDFSDTYTVDTAATCSAAGSQSQHCTRCDATRNSTPIAKTAHTPVSANNAVAATCTKDGKNADTVCSVCGTTVTTGSAVAALGHNYGTASYTWTDDGKTCTAKRICSRNANHIDSEAATITSSVKVAATCTAKGTTTYTAKFNNAAFGTQTKEVQDIAALGHNFSSEYTVDVAPTATTAGSKSQHCTRCDAKQNVTSIPATGYEYAAPTYTWSADGKTCTATRVSTNDPSHKETESATITSAVKTAATCTTKGTTTYTAKFNNAAFGTQTKEVQDIAALGHSYSSTYTVDVAATCTTDGSKSQHCSRCGDKRNVTAISATGHNYGAATYTWSNDNSICTGKRICSNDASHVYTENASATSAVTTAATCTAKGTTTYTATFKNSSFTKQTKNVQNLNALGHNFSSTYTVDTPATCTTAGSKSQHCTRCDAKQNVTTIAATGHAYGSPTYTWSADNQSCTATRVCSNNASHTETENATVTSAVTKAATCTAKGTTTYTASFKNTAFAKQTKTTEIAALGHDYSSEYTVDVEPTPSTAGSKSQHCSRCDSKRNVTTIPALGFEYGAPTYTWSADGKTCTATRVSTNDPSHKESETATSASVVKIAATCTAKGTTAYTVKFSNTAFTTQTKEIQDIAALGHNYSSSYTVDTAATCTTAGSKSQHCSRCGDKRNVTSIPAIGHAYGTPAYTWSADNQTCTAKRTCSNDASHVETENASITSTVKTAATCTAKGTTTYTAKFTNAAFATQTKNVQDIAALGHDYSSAYTVDTAATCTTAGSKSQHCSRCDDKRNVTSIPAIGHAYGTPTYTWSADGSTCTAQRTCSNDSSHVEKENGTITSVVKTSASCTVKGTTTYTAKFANTAFKTQTKDIQDIAALGHDYSSAYTVDTAATCTAAGSKSQHCSRCDDKRNVTSVPIDPNNHTGEPVEGGPLRSEATQEASATYWYKWSCCGAQHNTYYSSGDPLPPDEPSLEEYTNNAGFYDVDGNLLRAWRDLDIDYSLRLNCNEDMIWSAINKSDLFDIFDSPDIYFDNPRSMPNAVYATLEEFPNTYKIVYPDNLSFIPEFAFANCTATEYVIPDTVSELGAGAFYCAQSASGEIPMLCLPEGITRINPLTFCFGYQPGCFGVMLPSTTNTVCSVAFLGCTVLNVSGLSEIHSLAFMHSYLAEVEAEDIENSLDTRISLPNVTDLPLEAMVNCVFSEVYLMNPNFDVENFISMSGKYFDILRNLYGMDEYSSEEIYAFALQFFGLNKYAQDDLLPPYQIFHTASGCYVNSLVAYEMAGKEPNVEEMYNQGVPILSRIPCPEHGSSEYTNGAGLYDRAGNLLVAWSDLDIDYSVRVKLSDDEILNYNFDLGDDTHYTECESAVMDNPRSMYSALHAEYEKYPDVYKIIYPNNIDFIPEFAFAECPALIIEIPENVSEIGVAAFMNAIPNASEEEISSNHFKWPESITEVPALAFAGSHQWVDLPESITEVHPFAFCYGAIVNIPASIVKLDADAFAYHRPSAYCEFILHYEELDPEEMATVINRCVNLSLPNVKELCLASICTMPEYLMPTNIYLMNPDFEEITVSLYDDEQYILGSMINSQYMFEPRVHTPDKCYHVVGESYGNYTFEEFECPEHPRGGEYTGPYTNNAGLYDEDGNLLVRWDALGINPYLEPEILSDDDILAEILDAIIKMPESLFETRHNTEAKTSYAYSLCMKIAPTFIEFLDTPGSMSYQLRNAIEANPTTRKIVYPDNLAFVPSLGFALTGSSTAATLEVELPASVKDIKPLAFTGAFILSGIDISSTQTFIHPGAFIMGYCLTNLANNTTQIAPGAFAFSEFPAIQGLENIREIGTLAFAGIGLFDWDLGEYIKLYSDDFSYTARLEFPNITELYADSFLFGSQTYLPHIVVPNLNAPIKLKYSDEFKALISSNRFSGVSENAIYDVCNNYAFRGEKIHASNGCYEVPTVSGNESLREVACIYHIAHNFLPLSALGISSSTISTSDIVTINGLRYRVAAVDDIKAGEDYEIADKDAYKIVTLMALDAPKSMKYNSLSKTGKIGNYEGTGQIYSGSDVDTYLNGEFYNSLPEQIRKCIITTYLSQYIYETVNGSGYNKTLSGTRYKMSDKGSSPCMKRQIFEPGFNYLSEWNVAGFWGIEGKDLNKFFFETTSAVDRNVWLNSAATENNAYACSVDGRTGRVLNTSTAAGNSFEVRPTFRIAVKLG